MQVSSSSQTSPANIPLSLQSSRPHSREDRTVSAIVPRSAPQECVPPPPAPISHPPVELDPGTEKKLSRIKEVQVAFRAALNIANSIEEHYLLDPII
jgi:hypothetical protein